MENRGNRKRGVLLFLLWLLAGSLLSPTPAVAKKAARPHKLSIEHNNRGVTYLYQGNPERALFEFQTAVEVDPLYVEAQTNLGVAYKVLGQYDEAKAAFERAIALDKEYATPFNHLGTIYYTRGEYDKAIELFRSAAKKNKKYADAWLNLGLTQVAIANRSGGDLETLKQAIEPLRNATDIDVSYSRAHQELAKIYQRMGDFDKAIIRYKLSLETDTQNIDSWIELGTLYAEKQELIQAKNCLSQALRLSPQSVPAHERLGMVYLKEGNTPLAISEFKNTLAIAPSNEMAYFQLGYALLLSGNREDEMGNAEPAAAYYKDAAHAYIEALNLNPNFADAAYNAAYAYSILKDFKQAETYYLKAIEAKPNHGKALLAMGLMKQDEGNRDSANLYLCRALKTPDGGLSEGDKTLAKSVSQSNGGCH